MGIIPEKTVLELLGILRILTPTSSSDLEDQPTSGGFTNCILSKFLFQKFSRNKHLHDHFDSLLPGPYFQ